MIMLFEDDGESGIGRMLTYAYSQFPNPDVVKFTMGNRNIINRIKELNDGVTEMLVYIDVMPDNFLTIREFNRVSKWVTNNGLSNVHIFPIPCIEYYAIAAFLDPRYKEVSTVLDFNLYKQVSVNHRGKELACKSFEKYCKSVLNNYIGCLKPSGEFYIGDCTCNQRQQLCVSGDLYRKAWQLVGKLPVFVISSNMSVPISTRCVDVKDVQKRLADKFNLVVLRYITLGLIVRPVKLVRCKETDMYEILL